MAEQRDQMARWIAQSLYDSLASDHDSDYNEDDRRDAFFRTVSVVLGTDGTMEDIDRLDHITLEDLRSVIMYLKASHDSSLQHDRIQFILNITLATTDAAINYEGAESNKRKRTG